MLNNCYWQTTLKYLNINIQMNNILRLQILCLTAIIHDMISLYISNKNPNIVFLLMKKFKYIFLKVR